ncbi:MAG: four helix bundle protein [Planctomycetaceae bacterium]|nr:four helix bundle protein [Planctomycetaceae bacterium]
MDELVEVALDRPSTSKWSRIHSDCTIHQQVSHLGPTPMTTYKRFEDLPVWRISVQLAARMFPWTQRNVARGNGDLANQLQRAVHSISNNIAEGFERGSTNELLQFLYIARGSAGEVRSMLCVMELIPVFDHLRSEISDLKAECEMISRQIRGWADSLQNSEIAGQRHLNDKTRRQYERRQQRSAFMQRQEEFRQEMEERLNREAAERRGKQQNDISRDA